MSEVRGEVRVNCLMNPRGEREGGEERDGEGDYDD